MIWTKGKVQFYIDDPAHPYESFTPENTKGTWPFDQGPQFILLNLAVGGDWPGNVDSTTVFPPRCWSTTCAFTPTERRQSERRAGPVWDGSIRLSEKLCLVYAPSFFVLVVFFAAAFANAQADAVRVASPDDQLVLTSPPARAPRPQCAATRASREGLRYSVEFHGKPLFVDSPLGLKLEGPQPALGPSMRLVNQEKSSGDQTYTIPVGKTSSVRDHYNSVRADFEDAQGRKLTVEARAYDDGVAFRYILPEQPAIKSATSSASSPSSATARTRSPIR